MASRGRGSTSFSGSEAFLLPPDLLRSRMILLLAFDYLRSVSVELYLDVLQVVHHGGVVEYVPMAHLRSRIFQLVLAMVVQVVGLVVLVHHLDLRSWQSRLPVVPG